MFDRVLNTPLPSAWHKFRTAIKYMLYLQWKFATCIYSRVNILFLIRFVKEKQKENPEISFFCDVEYLSYWFALNSNTTEELLGLFLLFLLFLMFLNQKDSLNISNFCFFRLNQSINILLFDTKPLFTRNHHSILNVIQSLPECCFWMYITKHWSLNFVDNVTYLYVFLVVVQVVLQAN